MLGKFFSLLFSIMDQLENLKDEIPKNPRSSAETNIIYLKSMIDKFKPSLNHDFEYIMSVSEINPQMTRLFY